MKSRTITTAQKFELKEGTIPAKFQSEKCTVKRFLLRGIIKWLQHLVKSQ